MVNSAEDVKLSSGLAGNARAPAPRRWRTDGSLYAESGFAGSSGTPSHMRIWSATAMPVRPATKLCNASTLHPQRARWLRNTQQGVASAISVLDDDRWRCRECQGTNGTRITWYVYL